MLQARMGAWVSVRTSSNHKFLALTLTLILELRLEEDKHIR